MAHPFVPGVNLLQVRMQFLTKTQDMAENVYWVKKSAPWDLTHVNTMLGAFLTWHTTAVGGHSPQTLQESHHALVEISGRDFTTQAGISVALSSGSLPAVGTNANSALPPGITFALTARTGLAGRSYRGRTFLIGMAVDQFTDETLGAVAPAAVTEYLACWNALITDVTAADAAAELVVASFYGGVPPVGGVSQPRATAVMTPVVAFGNHNLDQDFQRRRSPQHHRHH